MSSTSAGSPEHPEPEGPTPLSYVEHSDGNGVVTIALSGELDLATAGEARNAIRRACERAKEVICDLGSVWFIDVTGVHALIDATAEARRSGRRLAIALCPPIVMRILGLLRLDDALEVVSLAATAAPPPAPEPRTPLRLVEDLQDL